MRPVLSLAQYQAFLTAAGRRLSGPMRRLTTMRTINSYEGATDELEEALAAELDALSLITPPAAAAKVHQRLRGILGAIVSRGLFQGGEVAHCDHFAIGAERSRRTDQHPARPDASAET